MGHAGGVEHDALRVLRQQVDEDLAVGLPAGQTGVVHGHGPVSEVIGQAATGKPEGGAAAGLGDGGPVLVSVEHGGSSEHHGGGSQGAGPSLGLLDKHGVLVDLLVGGGSGGRRHRCQ